MAVVWSAIAGRSPTLRGPHQLSKMEEAKKTCLPEFLIRIGFLILKGKEKHQKAVLRVQGQLRVPIRLRWPGPLPYTFKTCFLSERGKVKDTFDYVSFYRSCACEDLMYQIT